MTGSIDKYASLFYVDMKNEFTYRGDAVVNFVFSIAYPLIMLFVWSAVYVATNTSSIGNFTLQNMIVYFFVLSVLGEIAYPEVAWLLESDIRNSNIATYFARPISYIAGIVLSSVSTDVFFSLLPGIPIVAALLLVFHISVTLQLAAVLAVEVLACFIIATLIGLMVGAMAVYVTRIAGIQRFVYYVSALLGGGVIPLSLFPAHTAAILSLLPFQFIFYVPAATLSGALTIGASIEALKLALLWVAALLALAYAVWSRAKSHINAVGV